MAAVSWLETLRGLEQDFQQQARVEEELASGGIIGGESTREKLLDWAGGLRGLAGMTKGIRQMLLDRSAEQMAEEFQKQFAQGVGRRGTVIEQPRIPGL